MGRRCQGRREEGKKRTYLGELGEGVCVWLGAKGGMAEGIEESARRRVAFGFFDGGEEEEELGEGVGVEGGEDVVVVAFQCL